MTRFGHWVLMVMLLSACQTPAPPERLRLDLVSFDALPGWYVQNHADALEAFRRSCTVWRKKPATLPQNVGGQAVAPQRWHDVCAAAQTATDAAAFFETHFRPWRATSGGGEDTGLLTGYYEPLLQGAAEPGEEFAWPVWGVPADLDPATPYLTRREIDEQGLKDKAKPLLWVNDPVDLFFLHVQGSGRVTLADGTVRSLGFAARNGHPYHSIGKYLIERGEMERETVTMQSLKAWLRGNPAAMREVLWQNPSYIFFRFSEAGGPLGAQGTALIAEASLAVDPQHIPYGVPVWLDTTLPPRPGRPADANNVGSYLWTALTGETTAPELTELYQRLVIAQDTGSAIKGPLRGDLFFGHGERAERLAGAMKQAAQFYLLLPAAP